MISSFTLGRMIGRRIGFFEEELEGVIIAGRTIGTCIGFEEELEGVITAGRMIGAFIGFEELEGVITAGRTIGAFIGFEKLEGVIAAEEAVFATLSASTCIKVSPFSKLSATIGVLPQRSLDDIVIYELKFLVNICFPM